MAISINPITRSNHENGNLSVDETNDNVKSPLLSLNSTSVDKDIIAPVSRRIGGGWQLAYTKTEDGKKAGGLQRIYLHQEGGAESRPGSIASLPVADDGDGVQASALISRSVLCLDDTMGQKSEPDSVGSDQAAAVY
ncbi:hypothetical protein Hanom_Chr10g00889541 [Helianthus anomalus]